MPKNKEPKFRIAIIPIKDNLPLGIVLKIIDPKDIPPAHTHALPKYKIIKTKTHTNSYAPATQTEKTTNRKQPPLFFYSVIMLSRIVALA
jgi:hypothetical protein